MSLFIKAILTQGMMNTEKGEEFKKGFKRPSVNLRTIVATYLTDTLTQEEMEQLLSTDRVKNSPELQEYVTLAKSVQERQINMGFDSPVENLREIAQERSTQSFSEIKINLNMCSFEISRAVYLEYFEKEYDEAQRIYRHFTTYYQSFFEKNQEEAENKFGSYPSSLEKIDGFWNYEHTMQGLAGMYVAIASLDNKNVDSESYQSLLSLAELGHGLAIFRLNTETDEKSQRIIQQLCNSNEFALGKLKQALDNDELWATESFVWNQEADNEIKLVPKAKATNPVTLMQAVESGNNLAFSKFEKQQTLPEVIERLDVIKRISLLDLDIQLPNEEELKSAEGGYGRKIESIPYQSNSSVQPILPKLEHAIFIKISQAVKKHPNWKHAKILLAECYKLAIGTEQSLIKALGHFVMVRDMDGRNYLPINHVDSCHLANEQEVIESLQAFTNTFESENILPEIKITKEYIEKNDSVSLYPDFSNAFTTEQAWLSKHFMPIIKVNLGLLKEEWQGIELPICLAYEPDDHKCQFIGEKTATFHNEYLNEGWYSFKLTDDNRYEFLGEEGYFFATEHQDTEGMINNRKDIQYRKELYQKTGDLHEERYRNGEDILEPVGKNANGEQTPYFVFGGENPRPYNFIPPNYYFNLDNEIVTMDDKPLFHIITLSEAFFAEYYRIGDISVFFEPDSRLVLYSCKHTRVC